MYSFLLFSHSLTRWFVLTAILVILIRSYYGWLKNKPYTVADNRLRVIGLAVFHIQAAMGIILYSISPIIDYFFNNFKSAVHERDIRFFGMEHSLMMFISLVIITVASISSKKQTSDKEKFRILAIWFTVAAVIILFSIPWSFGSITANRPLFRGF